MYCNKCGKELPTESLFCPYCGEKQEVIASHGNDNSITNEQKIEEKSIQSTQTCDKTKASSVADEIISNLKMIGLAVLLSALYIGIFWTCHIKDRKPVQENYYGYSCYDPVMMRYYETNWEKIYDVMRYYETNLEKIHDDKSLYDDILKKSGIKNTIKNTRLIKSDEDLIKEAKELADNNKKKFEEEINSTRERRASNDLEKHLKYSILIALAVTVFGRYFIKGIKWVVHNKS